MCPQLPTGPVTILACGCQSRSLLCTRVGSESRSPFSQIRHHSREQDRWLRSLTFFRCRMSFWKKLS